jgi:nicotinic acid mononucleotide adenylyltransferase
VAEIAGILDRLESSGEPLVARFDQGPPLAGRIAVLPAAFNPPTLAHAHLLALGAEEPGIDTAAALLSTRNVDKGLHGATLEQRVEMLLALPEEQPIAVLAANQARLVDQSRALERSFPGVEFDFIVGYDTLVRLFDPRYYEDMRAELEPFFARHRVLATNRAHHRTDEVQRFIASDPIARQFRPRILVRSIPDKPASYSSSTSREHAASGVELSQLPASVAAYVREHRLYRT